MISHERGKLCYNFSGSTNAQEIHYIAKDICYMYRTYSHLSYIIKNEAFVSVRFAYIVIKYRFDDAL
jgi:hypothetical protein